MTSTRLRRAHRAGRWQSVIRGLRYRLVVPVFRSAHPPEYTARGVASGVFWGLTPTVGLQSVGILATWLVARRMLRKDSSLLQAFIWVWVNNPVTMIPIYYLSYVTGLWLLGQGSRGTGYAVFLNLWDASATGDWWARVPRLWDAIGLPLVIGSLPYAALGAVVSYRWARAAARRRRQRVGNASTPP